MAEKQATVYIIDVGRSMGKKHGGRKQTDLEWSMLWLWDKVTSIVSLDRKTTLQAVIGLKTDASENELAESDESYNHISVFQELGQIQMPDLRRLQKTIEPSATTEGDAISALVVAIQMISKTCKKLKYKREIYLITSGRGELDTDLASQIVEKLKEDDIHLVILGVDFDDPDYGYKEEDKDTDKAENEKTLKSLAEECNGTCGTLVEAIEELGMPRLKSTRPVPTFKGQLILGDPENKHGNTLFIDVERYPKTMVRKPPPARSYAVQKTDSTQSSTTMISSALMEEVASGDNFGGLHTERLYEVEDPDVSGGKRTVKSEELAKGYEYGRTAVPISDSDWNVLKLETSAGLQIIGFIPIDNFPRQMAMSQSSIIVGAKGNTKAIMALSSLIHALDEVESYAVGRLVVKDGKGPLIVVLAPSIDPDFECLIQVELPFAEDVRSYQFPPLDKVITVSGKVLKEHRNLPSDALKEAMSDYVDQMDLSNYDHDDEGEDEDYAQMHDVYSPMYHRIDQAVRWRASHPKDPVPPPAKVLVKYREPPEELVKKSKEQLEQLVKVAEVKKVPEQSKSRKRRADGSAPISSLDVESLLKAGRNKRLHFDSNNAIKDFENYINDGYDPDRLIDGAAELGKILEKRVQESFGDAHYSSALDDMAEFRRLMQEEEAYGVWNAWVKEFKRKLLGKELGGDRREMWFKVREKGVGLLEKGGASKEEAKAFLSGKLE